MAARNFSLGFERGGIFLNDTGDATRVYNDNEACVKWCHNMTSKSTNHMELWENSTREWVLKGTIDIRHVAGLCNIADIFTKEIKDRALFCRLRDSFMSRVTDFVHAAAAA